MPHILVTGAAGFIGSHLVEALSAKGYSITGLVLPKEDIRYLKNRNVRIVEGDITDKSSLLEALCDIDIICHLAGILKSKDKSIFYRVNFEGTKNVVEKCIEKNTQLKRFLFVSSISAMGPTSNIIKKEDSSCNPINDYGKSKLLAEQYLKSEANPFPTTIIRPVEIYGPRRFDSFYQICRIAKKRLQFRVGEGDITLGYIDDIVDGIIRAMEYPKAVGETYLLGENRSYSMADVTKAFSRAVRRKLIKIRIPYGPLYAITSLLEAYAKITHAEPPVTRWQLRSYIRQCYWRFDITKAEKVLGFRAKVPLEEGAKRTAQWYKQEGYL